jgi:hypothetical protein
MQANRRHMATQTKIAHKIFLYFVFFIEKCGRDENERPRQIKRQMKIRARR